MLVQLSQGLVVGPTDSNDRSWLIQSNLGIERVFHDDPEGTGEIICVDDEGTTEIFPEVKVGDQVQSLIGVLDFRLGQYCIQLLSPPELIVPD